MAQDSESKDKKDARTLAIVLIVLLTVLAIAGALLLPGLAEMASVHLQPGLGLKDSALLAFAATVVVMIVFAVAAGDGLVGELPIMLVGFFLFFVVIWLLLAWVF